MDTGDMDPPDDTEYDTEADEEIEAEWEKTGRRNELIIVSVAAALALLFVYQLDGFRLGGSGPAMRAIMCCVCFGCIMACIVSSFFILFFSLFSA